MNLRFYPLLICVFLACTTVFAQAKKLAICVGINEYQHDDLAKLTVAEKDATALHNYFVSQQWRSQLLVGNNATKSAIEATLKTQLATFKAGDTIVVFFAGHGLQFEGKEDGYFCGVDALPFVQKFETMVSLKWVYEELQQSYTGVKILLVDACRNDPKSARSVKARGGIDSSVNVQPPAGVSAFFACKPGQQSFEGSQHGLFTQSLLEGLRDGKAANRRNRITWDSLKEYVKERTEELAIARGMNQNPEERTGGLTGVPVLALVTPTPLPDVASKMPVSANERAADKAATKLFSLDNDAQPLKAPFSAAEALAAQKAWAAKLGLSSHEIKSEACGMEFVLIPPGEFMMGSPDSGKGAPANEGPQHKVRITKPFYLGKYEVTKGEWKEVMGSDPWKGKASEKDGDRSPADLISHEQAIRFAKRLSDRDGTTYRLPTEAEWEYACRGGTTTRWHFGDNGDRLLNFAWFSWNKRDLRDFHPHAVGAKKPNPFGLFDMHGNVAELCSDGYVESFYQTSSSLDPENAQFTDGVVVRGGSWNTRPEETRSASRAVDRRAVPDHATGFRLLRIP